MGFAYWLNVAACFLVPIAFAIWWIRMKLGVDKRWFVHPSKSFVSRGLYFTLPTTTIGLTSFLIGTVIWTLDPNEPFFKSEISNLILNASLVIFAVCFILGFVFAYFEPDWMSPDWFRWLKREHSDILDLLEREADKLGRAKWFPIVKTQEGLETWVAEVRHKYGSYKK
jgi:hypothetical protein